MTLTKEYIIGFCVVLGAAVFVSCSESSSGGIVSDQPPKIPPAQSAAMDLSIFTSGQPDSNDTGNHENYEAAAESIRIIQAIMDRSINLSMNLFENADTSDAEEIGEGKWQWTYSAGQEGSPKYDFRLVAMQEEDNELGWELYSSGPFVPNSHDEKLLLSGTTNNEVTEGVWTYYSFGRTGQPAQQIAELDWKIDEDENVDIELKILASNLSGSGMEYHAEGAVRTIELNSANDEEEIIIEFNTDTNAGFIISPDYNNGEKACWDSDFENVDCPET